MTPPSRAEPQPASGPGPLAPPASRPLLGLRVLVTRPPSGSAAFAEALRALGAVPVLAPAIDVRALEDTTALDLALRRLGTYDWVVFTSANGVRQAWSRLEALGLGAALEDGEHGRPPGVPRVAAIGPATAAALERRGVRPDYVPPEYVAEALAGGLPIGGGARILCLRADLARAALREILTRRGAHVDDVAAYRTVPQRAPEGAHGGRAHDARPAVDVVTFTSPSTVRGHVARFGAPPAATAIVCIGPVTARAARELGLDVHAVAERYTVDGLLEALRRLAPRESVRPADRGAVAREDA